MATLMLVNPKRRKRRAKSRKRAKRSRKGRMPAGLRRYWAAKRAGKKARSSSAPKRRRRRSRSRAVKANPRRRRHRNPSFFGKMRRRRRRHSAVKHRRRHSNPSLRGISSSLMPTVKSGFIGALGGLGLDLLWGKTSQYLPASISGSNAAQYAVKLLGAVLVGFVGNYALKGKGRDLAVGAATIVLHDALKATLQAQAPTTFGPGGTLGLGLYLNGAGPIVGTATQPFTPITSNDNSSYAGLGRMGRVGIYMGGLGGSAGDSSIYMDDRSGDSDW